MTVKQLIELLNTVHPDLTVVVNMGKNELANGKEAKNIIEENAIKSDIQGLFYREYDGFVEESEARQRVINITS